MPEGAPLEDTEPARRCADSMHEALASSGVAGQFIRLPVDSQRCLAARLHLYCAEALAARATPEEVQRVELTRAETARFKKQSCARAEQSGVFQSVYESVVSEWNRRQGEQSGHSR